MVLMTGVLMMGGSERSSHEQWDDNSQGIARQDAPARHRRPSESLRPMRHITPPTHPVGHPDAFGRIPRAPSVREDRDMADIGTTELPPRGVRPYAQLPPFYLDETVLLQEIKKVIDDLERMNQRVRRAYELGTQAGIYTDILQCNTVTYIAEGAQWLNKARKSQRAYLEQHTHDDPPEGA